MNNLVKVARCKLGSQRNQRNNQDSGSVNKSGCPPMLKRTHEQLPPLHGPLEAGGLPEELPGELFWSFFLPSW